MQASYSELAEGNYCGMSMQVAERQILRYAKDIIWVNKDKHTIEEMQKLLKVNCLHKGDFDTTKGKKFLVAVDGSLSSHSALETALKLVEEDDHLFVVTSKMLLLLLLLLHNISRDKQPSYLIISVCLLCHS